MSQLVVSWKVTKASQEPYAFFRTEEGCRMFPQEVVPIADYTVSHPRRQQSPQYSG